MVDQALGTLTAWFFVAFAFLNAFLDVIDRAMRHGLGQAGVPVGMQVLLVLLVDIMLIAVVLRLFGGVVRALLLVFLVLLVLRIVAPALGA